MRKWNVENTEAYEFSAIIESQPQMFGLMPGGCDYWLNVYSSPNNVAFRDDSAFKGRTRVVKVYLEWVTPENEILYVVKPSLRISRVSLPGEALDAIDEAREYYAGSPGGKPGAVKIRVWAPLGTVIQLYRYKQRWVSEQRN